MAENHYYYGCFRKTIIQLANIFNNIKVAKYDESGTITKYITVPLKFATKDKMFMSIEDNKRTRPLPMMALSMYGITHDPMRIPGKAQQITINKDTTNSNANTFIVPSPYNLDFQITIATKYMAEMDQILEQILAYFNPFVYIRIKFDEIPGQAFDVRILFTSATPELQTDLTEQEMRVISWTLYFTCYTYIFTPVSQEGITKNIITKYYTNLDLMNTYNGTESVFTSGASGSFEAESMFLKAIGYDNEGEVDYIDERFSVEDYE